MADQICYSVLCVFSYLAAGAEKSGSNQKIAANTPQATPIFVPLMTSCITPASPQDEHDVRNVYEPSSKVISESNKTHEVEKKEDMSAPTSISKPQNQIQGGSVTPTRGPPSYPPPALPQGVQPPALPPGNIKPVSGGPQVPPGRPGRPPPIPHRSSLSRQPSTPPPPPRPK